MDAPKKGMFASRIKPLPSPPGVDTRTFQPLPYRPRKAGQINWNEIPRLRRPDPNRYTRVVNDFIASRKIT